MAVDGSQCAAPPRLAPGKLLVVRADMHDDVGVW